MRKTWLDGVDGYQRRWHFGALLFGDVANVFLLFTRPRSVGLRVAVGAICVAGFLLRFAGFVVGYSGWKVKSSRVDAGGDGAHGCHYPSWRYLQWVSPLNFGLWTWWWWIFELANVGIFILIYLFIRVCVWLSLIKHLVFSLFFLINRAIMCFGFLS